MAGDTIMTVIGNLTADPELRFTASGAAVANFTVASTPRTFDRASGEWRDGEALFLRCNIWREAAENVAESLTRGSRVIERATERVRLVVRHGLAIREQAAVVVAAHEAVAMRRVHRTARAVDRQLVVVDAEAIAMGIAV